jgi:hypothetical protein
LHASEDILLGFLLRCLHVDLVQSLALALAQTLLQLLEVKALFLNLADYIVVEEGNLPLIEVEAFWELFVARVLVPQQILCRD